MRKRYELYMAFRKMTDYEEVRVTSVTVYTEWRSSAVVLVRRFCVWLDSKLSTDKAGLAATSSAEDLVEDTRVRTRGFRTAGWSPLSAERYSFSVANDSREGEGIGARIASPTVLEPSTPAGEPGMEESLMLCSACGSSRLLRCKVFADDWRLSERGGIGGGD
jgi:hypothetical protein